jgi:hypothetical protein
MLAALALTCTSSCSHSCRRTTSDGYRADCSAGVCLRVCRNKTLRQHLRAGDLSPCSTKPARMRFRHTYRHRQAGRRTGTDIQSGRQTDSLTCSTPISMRHSCSPRQHGQAPQQQAQANPARAMSCADSGSARRAAGSRRRRRGEWSLFGILKAPGDS